MAGVMAVLQSLRIRSVALIDELELDFGPGLSVLTGETGAGKSIVINALALVLGGRAQVDAIRAGSETASVEAVFAVEPEEPVAGLLEAQELWESDGQLVLSRELSRNNRNKCRINGRLVSASLLAEVGSHLVEIHGQHENQRLLDPGHHLGFLDEFHLPELQVAKRDVADMFARWSDARRDLAQIQAKLRDRARRQDLLAFQLDEIDKAALTPGEDEALERERSLLLHSERLRTESGRAYAALLSEEPSASGAVDALGVAISALHGLVRYDSGAGDWLQRLEAAQAELQELAHELHAYGENLFADPDRLAEVDRRLEQLERLKKKYGATLGDVLAFAADLRREADELDQAEIHTEVLSGEVRTLDGQLAAACSRLRRTRREAARALDAAVTNELRELGMAQASFKVDLAPAPPAGEGLEVDGEPCGVGPTGADAAEFMLAPNPGEPALALARTASGGELSRTMLALRTVLARTDGATTLIFDEVDAGIGGRTALAVAQKLFALGRTRQVLCVTHLAQIAAYADGHLRVDKVSGRRTGVHVSPVTGDDRLAELARMLGGTQTQITLQHARELLAMRGA